MINPDRIKNFVGQFHLLIPTIEKLNKAKITWMIGGSGCLYLLGNERRPDDVDIFLLDSEHDRADALFGITSYIHTSAAGPVRNSNPQGDHSLQFTSHLDFDIDGKHYEFRITDQIIQNRIHFTYEGNHMWLLPPEDVLLIKGVLQRGPEVGKYDFEDTANFRKIHDIDLGYLQSRIRELKAQDRIGNFFD